MVKFDEIDSKILRLLIEDSRMNKTDIAKDCGLSSVSIINRINLMKRSRLVIKPVLSLNLACFGYAHPVVIGVNLDPSIEQDIIKLITEHTIVAGIDETFGEYDLCLFVFAKDLKDLDKLKNILMHQNGVFDLELHIWHDFNLNYSNINLHIE